MIYNFGIQDFDENEFDQNHPKSPFWTLKMKNHHQNDDQAAKI